MPQAVRAQVQTEITLARLKQLVAHPCPYVSIPLPGRLPMVLERQRLKAVLRGAQITDIALHAEDSGWRQDEGKLWKLTLTHRSGRVRGTATFYNLLQTKDSHWRRFTFPKELRAFADKFRDDRRKPPKSDRRRVPRAVKFEQQAAKLERELARKWGRADYFDKLPVHPLIPTPEHERVRRELPSKPCYCDGATHLIVTGNAHRWKAHCPACGSQHENVAEELLWREQKAARKRLARIAGDVLRHNITAVTGYKRVREAGFTLQFTWGERRQPYRDKWKSERYWRNLYHVCGLTGYDSYRAYASAPGPDAIQQHNQYRAEFLQERRERQSLINQIASLRAMAAESEAAA